MRSIRTLPSTQIELGLRQLNIAGASPLDALQATRIGENLGVRRVVFGSYWKMDGQWKISARVINVGTQKESTEILVSSAEWPKAILELTEKILPEFGISPSQAERQALAQPLSRSPEAFECLSKAIHVWRTEQSPDEVENLAQKAVRADPKFAEAYEILAASQAQQDELGDATRNANAALRIRPHDGRIRLLLGMLHLFQGNAEEAELSLREANRLDPHSPEALIGLADLYAGQNKWFQAVAYLEKARALDASSGRVRVRLALAHAHRKNRPQALSELDEALRLDAGNPEIERMAAQTADLIGETPKAIERLEAFLNAAKDAHEKDESLRPYEERLQYLRASLRASYVETDQPAGYSEAEWRAKLEKQLTEAELKLVENPLAATDAMNRWARELIAGASTDEEKARRLFESLSRRVDSGQGGSRTALETFAAWKNSKISFRCQEYARLYVALARAVGLSSFFVFVERDYQERMVPHACAAVFINGKVLLADPSYRWFGVAHKGFTVLDDFEATVNYLTQLNSLAKCRIAVKLNPDLPIAQLNLAVSLMESGQLDEARSVLQHAFRNSPNHWMAPYAQGILAKVNGQWESAEKFFRDSLLLNPHSDQAHLLLGDSLVRQGRMRDAREAYRSAIKCGGEPSNLHSARRGVAQISEILGSD